MFTLTITRNRALTVAQRATNEVIADLADRVCRYLDGETAAVSVVLADDDAAMMGLGLYTHATDLLTPQERASIAGLDPALRQRVIARINGRA